MTLPVIPGCWRTFLVREMLLALASEDDEPGIVMGFVPGSVRVGHHDVHIGHVEGQVVVSTVPEMSL